MNSRYVQFQAGCYFSFLLTVFQIKEPEPEAESQVEYDCDLLNDDELFIKLQSDDIQSLFGELEEEIKATSPSQEVSLHA